jgi:CheY-like chemotaxis protein
MSAKTILIVDDEENIRNLLSEFLTASGYQTVVSESVPKAIQSLQGGHPDLILLDLKMPGLQGDSFLKFVRQLRADLPVIIVSGYLTPDLVKDLLQLGANGFITKPFQLDRVLTEIKRVSPSIEVPAVPSQETGEETTSEATTGESRDITPGAVSSSEETPVTTTIDESRDVSSEVSEGEEELLPALESPPLPEDTATEVIRMTGNVTHAGGDIVHPESDIEIGGSVMKGPYQILGKNITVGGVIEEGPTIEASQNLKVDEGIFGLVRGAGGDQSGRPRLGSGEKARGDEIRVGGTLSGKFIRNRTKVTAQTLKVEQDISFSMVEVYGRGQAGQVVGGSLAFGEYFTVNKLGASGGTVTKVEIGADLGNQEHLKDVEGRIATRERLLHDLRGRYDFEPIHHLQAERDRYIQHLRDRGHAEPESRGLVKSLTERIEQRQAELLQLRDQIRETERILKSEREEREQVIASIEASSHAELFVRDVVYPRVTVQMKGNTYQSDRELHGVRFYLKENKLIYESIARSLLTARRPTRRQE